VITTFDRPEYLEECLASVKHQTLTGFRLVVLDNASAADYSGVLDRFRELPMTYVRNETNIGAAGNIRQAFQRYSDSKYLMVFHDDDMMHPRMLEWQLEVLEADPEVQFVSTELAAFDDGDEPPRRVWENVGLDIEIYDDQSALARSLLGTGGLCFGSTIYRSSVLKQIALDEERFGIIWDRPFLLDAARLGKSALIRAPLVLYRHHPGQDTNTGSLRAKNLIELMKRYRAALPSGWNREDQDLFYGHARYFLVLYGYARLAPEERVGAITFVRKSIWNRVLRFQDVKGGVLEDLMRVDGRRMLPSAIEAARRAKRRLLPRRRRAAGDQHPDRSDRGQARHPEE
jgi:glycosyltransferase involved in cell wall biosynthesis